MLKNAEKMWYKKTTNESINRCYKQEESQQTFEKESVMRITSWVLLWLEQRIKVPKANKSRISKIF